jgi:2-keto-4-pentenoate hydratase/2-oxohepta-3-ene-1,7-dioic acid hydratase in catechol pathway
MKFAQFVLDASSGPRVGALADEKLIDVALLAAALKKAGGGAPDWLIEVSGVVDVISHGDEAVAEVQALMDEGRERGLVAGRPISVELDSVSFLPAVNAGKILAIGRNYVDHAIEGGSEPPKAPLVFNKLINSLSSHDAPIVLPDISTQVDYEAELAVIIGRRAKRVAEAAALDYVFGYTLINDVSARDLQFGDGQWVRGKGLDGFAPLGPFITTRDEISDPHALKIEGLLNGQVMQSSNTGKMIFKVPYLISYISQGITLEPGDVIATGTPDGVGIFRKPPVLLKAGDVFEVVIEKLGTLRNRVVEA